MWTYLIITGYILSNSVTVEHQDGSNTKTTNSVLAIHMFGHTFKFSLYFLRYFYGSQ